MLDYLQIPEDLKTNRLVLRKPVLADVPVIFQRYAKDPVVTKYLTWQPHKDEAETKAFLQLCRDQWQSGTAFPFVIATQARPDAPMGMVHLQRAGEAVELGYVLAQSFWGQGYATETVTALSTWLLRHPSVWRVQAYCDVENTASARVLEKSGFSFEGIARCYVIHRNISTVPRDCKLYARIA